MRAQIVGTVVLVFITITAYQNCGKSEDLLAKGFRQTSFSSTGPIPIGGGGGGGNTGGPPPPPGTVFADYQTCAAAPDIDACIFRKNPTAFNNGPMTPAPSYTRNYNTLQKYGVRLQNFSNTTYLDNNLFTVVASTITNVPFINAQGQLSTVVINDSVRPGNRLTRNPAGKWIFPYNTNGVADPRKTTAQVMGYYYLDLQRQMMRNKVGNFWVEQAGEKVLMYAFLPTTTNNAFAGSLGGSMRLDVNGDGIEEQFQSIIGMGFFSNLVPGGGTSEAALSAEVYLHEMGHRNFANAGTGGNTPAPVTLERECVANSGEYCCTSQLGCTGGIHEGQADFHLVFLFPDTVNASVGETTTNTLAGLPACILNGNITRTRNMATNTTMTPAEAFNNCGDNASFDGEVHGMGTLYANLWFEIWKAATNKNQIERVFNNHLRDMTPNDNFRTALQMAKGLDQSMFAGANAALYQRQLDRLN